MHEDRPTTDAGGATSAGGELVTVATFNDPLEAQLARGKLESAGVRSTLADDNLVAMDWYYTNAVGGVKLQVMPADMPAAREALAEVRAARSERESQGSVDEPMEAGETVCPKCGSPDVYYERFSRKLAFLSMLLLRVPLPFLKQKWTCEACGHTWET
jgi:hypothetical protein